MRTQRVLLGVILIEKGPEIELFVDLPDGEVRRQAAVLKDRLAYLLDTRFQPAAPIPQRPLGLTVEDVASDLHCRCRTVLRMMRRGDLHPIVVEGELYFDPHEVAAVRYLPIGKKIVKLVQPDRRIS